MGFYSANRPAPLSGFRVDVSLTESDPALQAAFGLSYAQVKGVSNVVGRGAFRKYDTIETTNTSDGGAKSHIKGQYQDEGLTGLELESFSGDPGQNVLFNMGDTSAVLPRVIRLRPTGDASGEREEYHYAHVTGYQSDEGTPGGRTLITIMLQCTGQPMARAIP